MEEQKRHSGFETMRILSMVMIVLMHGIGHGGLGSAAPQGSVAFWIYWLLFILARVSTNCFVMLSGYYLSERKGPVHAGRLFRIGAQVWFYSMLTFCVAVKAGAVPLSAVALLRALLPLTSNGYWFASAYFLMYLSVPVLNAVVQSLDRRQYKTLLLVALLLQSVWGTLFYWATDATFVNNGYSFIWFYTLYFMAAYFRKYRVTVPSGLCLLAYLAASAAGLFNRMLALRVENALHLNGFVNTVNGYQALATVIASAAIFLLFQNIRIRSDYWRRWVFRLAPLSFGVYLLHDSDFTRALLWQLVDLPRFGGALLPSLAYLTGAVLLVAASGLRSGCRVSAALPPAASARTGGKGGRFCNPHPAKRLLGARKRKEKRCRTNFSCDSAFSVHRPGLVEHLLHLRSQQSVGRAFQQRVGGQQGGGFALGGVQGAGVVHQIGDL